MNYSSKIEYFCDEVQMRIPNNDTGPEDLKIVLVAEKRNFNEDLKRHMGMILGMDYLESDPTDTPKSNLDLYIKCRQRVIEFTFSFVK